MPGGIVINNDNQDVVDNNTQTNGDKVDITKQTDSDFMEGTVDYIKDVQDKVEPGDAGTDDDANETQDINSVKDELAGSDIPDEFSSAAEAAGMTPEDIIALADGYTDKELIELIPYLEQSLENKDDTNDKVNKDVNKTDDKVNKDVDKNTELEKEIVDKISKQLEEKFGTSLKEINEFKAHQEEQSKIRAVDTVSKILDSASKDFPIFGKTDELPRFASGRLAGQLIPNSPALKARLEVLRYADAFMSQGANIDNAMSIALGTYKGLHLEKELERKLVQDLKRHETKLSGARVGRELKNKHVDTRDEIIDEIRQIQRAAGID
jgi:hypothetical protein